MTAAPACWTEEVRSPSLVAGARQVTLQWNLGIKTVPPLVGHGHDAKSEGHLLWVLSLQAGPGQHG